MTTICAICDRGLDENCSNCDNLCDKERDEGCRVAVGECGCAFHFHCIAPLLKIDRMCYHHEDIDFEYRMYLPRADYMATLRLRPKLAGKRTGIR